MSHEIGHRGHSHRKYEPDEFVVAMENANGHEERAEIRQVFRNLDGGRFYDFLDEGHNVFGHLDLDCREQFSSEHPNLMSWLLAFGAVEEMAKFEDWQP